MFRITCAVLGCLASSAGCSPEHSAPQPMQSGSTQVAFDDSDEVYLRETRSPDGKSTVREQKQVSYLAPPGYLIKFSRVIQRNLGNDQLQCRSNFDAFEKTATGSYANAWSISSHGCHAQMGHAHLIAISQRRYGDDPVNAYHVVATGKFLVRGSSDAVVPGADGRVVVYDHGPTTIANPGGALQGVIWLLNAERVLDRIDVTGVPSSEQPPQFEFADLQPSDSATVTFKYDAAQYALSVRGQRFEIPAASAAVFRRAALRQDERSTDQSSTISNSPPQPPVR